MWHKKIASNVRITSANNGAIVDYELPAFGGGSMIKQINVQLVIRQKSGNNMKVGLKLHHGPDGQRFILHSTPIASTNVASETLLNGDSDKTKMFGEYLLPVLTAASEITSSEWANVDVYLIGNPF